jgi:NodT family efflux transporter outer membrane factor (OMF) lipoprotein
MSPKSLSRILLWSSLLLLSACLPSLPTGKPKDLALPSQFDTQAPADTNSVAYQHWSHYFDDPHLHTLIEEALQHNQELHIALQEIAIRQNEVLARQGEYQPNLGLQIGLGLDKPGRYTRAGALEENLEVAPGRRFPSPLADLSVAAVASWEVDIWQKLRKAKKSAVLKYLATVEGRHFMVTNLVAEVAASYYELLALDNLLLIIQQNTELQRAVLEIVQKEKDNAKATQLAVNRFEAQWLNTQNLQFEVKQQIVATENRLNWLLGRFPQPIERDATRFFDIDADSIQTGLPLQLLANRADIRQAELALQASHLELEVARANFYPALRLNAGLGTNAFSPERLLDPHSVLYGLGGELIAPLLNRKTIATQYRNANAQQQQALYRYEQTLLTAHMEVLNQWAKIENYRQSYQTKKQEVALLTQSVEVANNLYRAARADYMEVLLTQREALNEKIELVETKAKLLAGKVTIYKALGGGWR